MTAHWPNQAGQECEPKNLGAVPTRCPKPLAGSLRAWHRLSGGWSHLLMGKQSGRPPFPPVQTGSTGIAELRRVRPSLSQAQPHGRVSEPGLELAPPALCSPGIKQELGTVVGGKMRVTMFLYHCLTRALSHLCGIFLKEEWEGAQM